MARRIVVIKPKITSHFSNGGKAQAPAPATEKQPKAISSAQADILVAFRHLDRLNRFAEENGMTDKPLHVVLAAWRRRNPLMG